MLAKNEVLQNRYRIIRQLGHGGMGAVYEARDERLGSSVALKEIIIELHKISGSKQQDIIRRAFEREARLLASLHHEAFPRVTDYFSEADTQFLIMELVNGDDLGERLHKTQKPFPFENVVKWTEQLLDALDYLHTQDPPTFHRDIKPQNLKVTSRGKIKLLDFGIAKSVDSASSTITNQTFVGATLNYSPIEQVLPALPETFREFIILKHSEKAKNILSQNTDARCDIYAIGATIYHLLTNRVPMDSAKRSLEIWEGNPDPLPNPIEFNDKIPTAFAVWLLKAMEIERDSRFSSAIEMQNALHETLLPEKSKSEIIEKTPLIETKSIIVEDKLLTNQEIKKKEQSLMQADTERLDTADKAKSKPEVEFIVDTQPAETQPLTQVPDTFSPVETPYSTDYSIVSAPETELPKSIPQLEVTETPYLNENIVENKKTSPEILPVVKYETAKASNNKSKFFWMLPIAALGVLGIGGIGATAMWYYSPPQTNPIIVNNSNSGNFNSANSSVANSNVNLNIEKTGNSNVANSSDIQAGASTSMPTPNNSGKPNKNPKPVIIVTPTPVPNTDKPPKPVITHTPKPKSDDCIYNGKCG